MLQTTVIDIDPDLLRKSAEAQVHAATEGLNHVAMEQTGHVPTILETLVSRGPWAWAIMMIPQPDGSIVLPVQTTFEAIEEIYTQIRGHSDILAASPVVEVNGTWYSMLEAFATAQVKETGDVGEYEMVLVLPVTNGPGITGELCWIKMDRRTLGKDLPLAEPKSSAEIRKHLLGLHDQLMESLRANDAEALVELFSPGCQCAIRDYVADTGTITGLDDVSGLREHYLAFFEQYEVRSVDLLQRVVQDWYLFAELRIEVSARSTLDRKRLAFHTATILVPGKEDRFIVQIGHGTDLSQPSGDSDSGVPD